MPKENLIYSQKQSRIFLLSLSEELDKNHKLYKLKQLINWEALDKSLEEIVKISELGRTKTCSRMMTGLMMLQAMYNFSDIKTAEQLGENVYWQYFCGFEYIETKISISESSVRRFRQEIGEEGYQIIMGELNRVAIEIGICKKKDLENVIIDTTVQIKNIKHPHDVHLMEKARLELVKLSEEYGIKLKETYAKKFKKDTIKLWKYRGDSKAKNRFKLQKGLKTRLGRLVRVVARNIESLGIELMAEDKVKWKKIVGIYEQSVLNKKEKEDYKVTKKVLYSFGSPEVECIGKGKLHKPYEFGNKVSICTGATNNFILGIKSFQDNPYDGHTLQQTIELVEKLTQHPVKKSFVDLGYRGSNVSDKRKVYTPYTKKKLNSFDKKMIKRRSAIEPIIGHVKKHGRMARNYLKGVIGNSLNALISAIGFNLRQLGNYLVKTAKTPT